MGRNNECIDEYCVRHFLESYDGYCGYFLYLWSDWPLLTPLLEAVASLIESQLQLHNMWANENNSRIPAYTPI